MSDYLQLHGLQHKRLPCPSLSPGVCSNSCPLNLWCHPIISLSVAHFSFCLQSFTASGSFLKNWLFTSGGQSIGAFALASVLPMNIQGWFPLGLIWCETSIIKLLEENIDKTLSDTNCSTIFFNPSPRIMETETKINKWDLRKFKGFCKAKETIIIKKTQR